MCLSHTVGNIPPLTFLCGWCSYVGLLKKSYPYLTWHHKNPFLLPHPLPPSPFQSPESEVLTFLLALPPPRIVYFNAYSITQDALFSLYYTPCPKQICDNTSVCVSLLIYISNLFLHLRGRGFAPCAVSA